MSRIVPLALIAILPACQPFYRDNLRAGRRADNWRVIDAKLDAANRAATAGDLPRAIELDREAIRESPTTERAFSQLAIHLRHAGEPRLAAAIVARAVIDFGGTFRRGLVSAFVDDDLTADALDHSTAVDLKDAATLPWLTKILEELAAADAGTVDASLAHYLRWLTAYGVPDHGLLRDASARIRKRFAEQIETRTALGMRLGAIGPRADLVAAAGDATGALFLYSLAFRVLPEEKFALYRGGMARTAATVTDPATSDPIAWGFAVEGDTAIKAGKLGAAIHAYRRAVAQAPWWSSAHGNLAELLALAGRTAEADLERAWVAGLAPGAGWATEPRDASRDADVDGDQVSSPSDQCPFEPEDRDSFADDDGCPELDNDRDGITDAADKCAGDAEDKDGFQDDDGCPDLDNDGDRVPDASDACPLKSETFNGTSDRDGCPDEGRVVVEDATLRLLDPIEFVGKTDKLARTAPKILDAVVATLAGYPALVVEIGGHGNVLGKPELDLQLTRARADAVMAYLTKHGIAAARLSAVGYADAKPVDPGTDAKALAKNRRIELQIRGR